ncbi:MAG: toll/interleukin-1 receptor domain-containing protein, partial [Pseudomonadota bacterium]
MAHVFISYARDKSSGQRAAKTIYDRLRDAGIDAFLDTERIEPGERWLQVINENLVESRIVLAVISEAVHDRPWVGKEYLQASAKNILVIPVLVEKDVDLPLWAADLQAADLTGDDRDSQWQRLLRRIQGLLATDAASQKRYRENVYLQDLLGQKPLPDIQRLYVELAGRHRREGTPARFLPGPLMPASFRHYRRPPEEPGEGWSEPTPYEDILQAF